MRQMGKSLLVVLWVFGATAGAWAAGAIPTCNASSMAALESKIFEGGDPGVPAPVFRSGPCSVSRNCDYPPPSSISCSGSSTCSSGTSGNGFVECDGSYQFCPPPPPPEPCTGWCGSSVQCWDYCNQGGIEPSMYQCIFPYHCCHCVYP